MPKQLSRLVVALAVVATSTALAGAASVPTAGSAAAWAPVATVPIHPGVQTHTAGAQCTANFVFSDATHVYIGQAAHCSGTGGNTETNGCTSASLPLGTSVTVAGASGPGTLVRNSWITMQSKGLGDDGAGWSHSVSTVSPASPATPGARSSTRAARRSGR